MSRGGQKPRAPADPDDATLLEAVMAKAKIVHDELTQLRAGPEWTLERVARALADHQNGTGPKLAWVVQAAEGGGFAIHYYHGDELIVRGRSFR